MSEEVRQVVAEYFNLGSGVTTISRKEPVRVRQTVITGTTDADAETDISLNVVGLLKPIVLGITVRIRDSATAGKWDIYDTRDAASATRAFLVTYLDGNHANPYTIRLSNVGANMQGQEFVCWFSWVERL